MAHDDPHGQVGASWSRPSPSRSSSCTRPTRDARGWDGERARVVSRRGAVTLQRPRSTTRLRPGTAFAPFHWGALHAPAGAGGVNDLTHRETDPVSRQPGLKATAIRVEPVAERAPQAPSKRVLIVGGGPAGVATAETAARARRLRDHDRQRRARAAVRPRRAHRPPRRPPRGDRPAAAQPSAGTASAGSSCCGADRRRRRDGASRRPPTGERIAYDALVLATGSRAVHAADRRASSARSRSAPATTSARSAAARTARAARS